MGTPPSRPIPRRITRRAAAHTGFLSLDVAANLAARVDPSFLSLIFAMTASVVYVFL